jgi:hypothetical protein
MPRELRVAHGRGQPVPPQIERRPPRLVSRLREIEHRLNEACARTQCSVENTALTLLAPGRQTRPSGIPSSRRTSATVDSRSSTRTSLRVRTMGRSHAVTASRHDATLNNGAVFHLVGRFN